MEVSNFVGPQILNCSSSVCARRSFGSARNLEVKSLVVGERAFAKGGWVEAGWCREPQLDYENLGNGCAGKITCHGTEGESLEIRETSKISSAGGCSCV